MAFDANIYIKSEWLLVMLRIFVPAYNEEHIIEQSVRFFLTKIGKQFYNFKLYLVDDGSTDNTGTIAKKLKLPHFQYVRCNGPSRRENLVQTMARISKDEDVVGFMDADRSTGLEALQGAVNAISKKKYDIVIGSRYVPGARIKRKPDRLFISKCFNAFVRLYFGSKIRDHECGFKFFRGRVLKELVKEMGINQQRKMFWDSEMLVRAQRKRLKVLEVPVSWVEGPKSALSFKKELPMVAYMVKLRFRV